MKLSMFHIFFHFPWTDRNTNLPRCDSFATPICCTVNSCRTIPIRKSGNFRGIKVMSLVSNILPTTDPGIVTQNSKINNWLMTEPVFQPNLSNKTKKIPKPYQACLLFLDTRVMANAFWITGWEFLIIRLFPRLHNRWYTNPSRIIAFY